MKLKIFFFPIALVIAVAMIIWYIWPAYQTNKTLKQKLKQKQEQLSVLEERKTLVDGLMAQINRDRSVKEFLFRYIPSAPDEEYVMNAIDDAAKRAGINLVVVDFVKNGTASFFSDSTKEQVATNMPDEGLSNEGMMDVAEEDFSNVAPQIRPPRIKEMTVNAVATGPYDGMKKFLNEVYKIDRMHGVISATLERVNTKNQSTNEFGSVALPKGAIIGKMIIGFAYMPHVKIPRGADGSLFQQSIPVEKVRAMQTQYTMAPALVTENVGRGNPFAGAHNQKKPAVNKSVPSENAATQPPAVE